MIKTHEDYWDCECERNYIHLKKDRLVCPLCKTEEDVGQPDSRIDELKEENFYKEEDIKDTEEFLNHEINKGVVK